jgi:hypothetical protein
MYRQTYAIPYSTLVIEWNVVEQPLLFATSMTISKNVPQSLSDGEQQCLKMQFYC